MKDNRNKRKVAVLGATGAVGQRFVQILSDHPWFEITALAASERSRGKSYGEAVRWLLPGGVPPAVARAKLLPPEPSKVQADVVFSALDASAADTLEPLFREAGFLVVSNARSFRADPEVPLVVPEINPEHLVLVTRQRKRHGGAIATNPNCSTIGLCLSLEPLRKTFGLKRVLVTTMQALSGAGYPGIPSMDIVDNVLTEISGEEEKIESEPHKIFGAGAQERGRRAELAVSAQCNRVAVRDGHTLSVSVELERPAGLGEIRRAFEEYESPLSPLNLPTAPERPVILTGDFARPQPLLDRDSGGGMAVTVGRLRDCPVLGVRYAALVHNTIRGAAGNTILIAELMVARGLA